MDVTLVIILHNRHQNIRRLVEYYRDIDASIILADSSAQKHPSECIPPSWNHIYTPGINYTQKIELILQQVSSRYVILCADDDFIIPASINVCTKFLEDHPDYSSVQGKCISYKKKDLVYNAEVNFSPLYPPETYSYENPDGLARIESLLAGYKSFLYAVHRTAILRNAYTNASQNIRSLFLNEYNASILPLAAGKYKELPVLYQVREYAEDSDDKTAITINKMMKEPRFKTEIDKFLGHLLQVTHRYMPGKNPEKITRTLIEGIDNLVASIDHNDAMKPSIKKRAGRIITLLPFVGPKMVRKNREKERQDKMSKIIVTQTEAEQLNEIKNILQHY